MIIFNGKVHFGFALIIWMMVVIIPDNPPPLHSIFLFGAIFPDADIKYSKIGKFIPLWLFFKHRGFTHTIWGMLFFSGIVYLICELRNYNALNISISFFLGCLLHVAMDSSTPMGINWWGTRKKKRAYN